MVLVHFAFSFKLFQQISRAWLHNLSPPNAKMRNLSATSYRKLWIGYIRVPSLHPDSSVLINFLASAKTCRSSWLQMLFITFVLSVFTFNFVFWHLSIPLFFTLAFSSVPGRVLQVQAKKKQKTQKKKSRVSVSCWWMLVHMLRWCIAVIFGNLV